MTRHRICVFLLLWAGAASAGPPPAASGTGIEPSLPPDKPLLEQIARLAPNTWMKLPRPKVGGELDWLSPRADD